MANVFIFLIGLVCGSFLNVCIWRIPRHQSIIFPASHCPHCGKPLAAWDLLPVLSFLFLHGRCRFCAADISWRYPMVEFLTGLIFLAAYQIIGWNRMLPADLFFIALLIAVSCIDMDSLRIPNSLILAGLLGGSIILSLLDRNRLGQGLWGFLAGGGLLLTFALCSKGGLGLGDVKLGMVIGLFLGRPLTILAIFLAAILASLVGIALILCRQKSRRDAIAFGPFLSLGGIIALFWGDRLTNLYLNYFFPGRIW